MREALKDIDRLHHIQERIGKKQVEQYIKEIETNK
jgi:hypothetical protein